MSNHGSDQLCGSPSLLLTPSCSPTASCVCAVVVTAVLSVWSSAWRHTRPRHGHVQLRSKTASMMLPTEKHQTCKGRKADKTETPHSGSLPHLVHECLRSSRCCTHSKPRLRHCTADARDDVRLLVQGNGEHARIWHSVEVRLFAATMRTGDDVVGLLSRISRLHQCLFHLTLHQAPLPHWDLGRREPWDVCR